MNEASFSIRELYVAYASIEAVRGISFEIPRRSSLVLVGHNGAGKSSTLLALSGSLPKHSFCGDMSIGKTGTGQMLGSGITLVPERDKVFNLLTVHENLLAVDHASDGDRVRIDDVYGFFPRLAERRTTLAGNMSGGEQQMLAIGSALLGSPQLLLLDEPTLGLAVPVIESICEKLTELRRELDLTLLIALAETGWVSALAEIAIVMDCGELTSEPLPTNEHVQDLLEQYLTGDKKKITPSSLTDDETVSIKVERHA